MFPLAQPNYYITHEELQLSVALFLRYPKSKSIVHLLGLDACGDIISFAKDKVLCNAEHFVYYKHHSPFHLEAHTNCGHEGTNNGIKHCAASVSPQNKLNTSVEILTFNAEIKAKNTSIEMCTKSNSRKSWSASPSSHIVTDLAESIILQQWKKRMNYNCT